MIKLDVAKTAFSGFGVIGRNPLAVLVWAVFLGVVGMLPALGLMGGFFSAIGQIIAAEQSGAEPTPEMIMPMVGSLVAMIPVLLLTGLIVRMVLTGAIFRAVLFPAESSWFYMRLGARELWLALLFIVVGVIAFVLSLAVAAVTVPFVLMASGQQDPMVQMLMIRAAMLPLYAVMIFLFVRFCLAFPATFAESRFRLLESWSMTRGNGWRIALVLLLLVALLLAAEMVLAIVIIIGVAAVIGTGAMKGDWSEEKIVAFFSQDPTVLIQSLWPWVAGLGLVGCILGVLFAVIFTAPWAEAYRQLKAAPDAVV